MTSSEPTTTRRTVLTLGAAGVGAAGVGAAGVGAATGTAAARQTTAIVDVLGVTVPADATDWSLAETDADEVAQSVGGKLSTARPTDVRVRPDRDAIEVLAAVDPDAVAAAVEAASGAAVDRDELSDRPTDPTMEATADGLEERLDELADGEASVERALDGTLEATVDGDSESLVRDAAAVRETRVVAHFPAETDRGYAREPLVTGEDVASHTVQKSTRTSGWYVQVTLTDGGSERFADRLVDAGFTDRGVRSCGGSEDPGAGDFCLLTVADDEVLFGAGLAPQLAEQIESGEFEERGEFRLTTQTEAAAQRARLGLTAPLPAPVRLQSVATESESVPDELPGPGVAGALGSLGLATLLLDRLVGASD